MSRHDDAYFVHVTYDGAYDGRRPWRWGLCLAEPQEDSDPTESLLCGHEADEEEAWQEGRWQGHRHGMRMVPTCDMCGMAGVARGPHEPELCDECLTDLAVSSAADAEVAQ